MNNTITAENQLFDWSGWDQQATASFTFYNPILKVKIGEFEVGTKFESACVDYEYSQLSLYTEDKEYVFELKLSVGQKVSENPFDSSDKEPKIKQ